MPWHNINYAVSDLGPDKHGTAPPGDGCNGWDGFTFHALASTPPRAVEMYISTSPLRKVTSRMELLAACSALSMRSAHVAWRRERCRCTSTQRHDAALAVSSFEQPHGVRVIFYIALVMAWCAWSFRLSSGAVRGTQR